MGSTDRSLEQFFLSERLARIDDVLARRTRSLTLVLDRVHHAHNISAIIRSADAFGICEIHLVGTTFEFSRAISKGSERWVELHRHESLSAALTSLAAAGFEPILFEPAREGRTSCPVHELPFEERLALVFGNELEGIAHDRSLPYRSAFIPMAGFVESLNVSVAVALTLFCSTLHVCESRRRTQPLTVEEREALRQYWLTNDLERSEIVLRELERRRKGEEESVEE